MDRSARDRRSDRSFCPALDGSKTLVDIVLTEVGGLTTFGFAKRATRIANWYSRCCGKWKPPAGSAETGERRGTRWYAITDEERSRERAPELVAQTVATS